MPDYTLTVNGHTHIVKNIPADTPLLWVLRDALHLSGTKYGCGIAACGACTVHLNGEPIRSCAFPISALNGVEIRTIEGLATDDGSLHPLQQAWIDTDVAQCGYCQAGQLMSAAALLEANPTPTDADIEDAMAGNICRCGTYNRIKTAIHKAADTLLKQGDQT